jgi:zinc/manganese transport system substrate-binding protein
VNGGGYDDFATQMLDASGNDTAIVIDAVELSGYEAAAEGFNEHVWYDYPTVRRVVAAIASALDEVDPAGAEGYDAATARLDAGLQDLQQRATGLAATASGRGVVITEPVPLYLLQALGLTNLTPPEFSEAIEEDTDVPPVLLQSVLTLLGDGSAALVVYNEQTGGPQTDAILDSASENRVPVVGVTETLPSGTDYLGWQAGYLDRISTALSD